MRNIKTALGNIKKYARNFIWSEKKILFSVLNFWCHCSLTFWHGCPVRAVVGDAVLPAGPGVVVRPGDVAGGLEVAGLFLDRSLHVGPVLAVGVGGALGSTTQPAATTYKLITIS